MLAAPKLESNPVIRLGMQRALGAIRRAIERRWLRNSGGRQGAGREAQSIKCGVLYDDPADRANQIKLL